MYELSRALYRELRPLLAVDQRSPGRVERLLLEACEQTLEGIAGGLHYFPSAAAHLFADVRFLFPVRDQIRVRAIIGVRVGKAQEELGEAQAIEGLNGRRRCLALTAQGAPCRREAQHSSRYCSSHRHMEGDAQSLPRFRRRGAMRAAQPVA